MINSTTTQVKTDTNVSNNAPIPKYQKETSKAGINAMLEAIYLRRPFLVTTVYYSVADAAHYVVTHDIGWYEPHPERQAAIICSCIEDPALLAAMDRNFDSLPIRFGADEIVRDVVETVAGKTKEFSKVDRRSCR